MINQILLILAVSLVLYFVYKYIRQNDDYFEKQNIKYLKPYFLFGNSFRFLFKLIRPSDWCDYFYNFYPNEKVYGIFSLTEPIYYIRDPELLKQLTVKDFDHFEDHRLFLKHPELDSILGNTIILLRGDRWRNMRSTLSPAFTGNKMRIMFDLVQECAETITKYYQLKLKTNKQVIELEMKDFFSKCTNDVIASIAFGIKVDSFNQPNNEFIQMGSKAINFNTIGGIVKVIAMNVVPWFMRIFHIELMESVAKKFFKSMIFDTMNFRDKNNIYRPDMIHIMMQLRNGLDIKENHEQINKNNNNDGFATVQESTNLIYNNKSTIKHQWTDDELIAQCFVFFFAGFDTTSTLLAFASYEIAVNTNVQDKLYEEISKIHRELNGEKLTYDKLQKMKYLDMVVSETLRHWPPIMITDRLCNKDYPFDDGNNRFIIPKDKLLFIPIYSYHHDEQFFPDPHKFDPERFSDENKINIIPGTYIPFGTGPRSCIASRFALMDAKILLYHFLLNFKFEPCEKTQIPLKLAKTPGGVFSEKGITLRFVAGK